ncbi:MAG: hypothetical protein J5I98_20815 [Phaeodactylibacter sp.]|nr:hypothetical protein [Phaeodactylibacter sp.]
MAVELVLHLGAHRTASTAMQFCFRDLCTEQYQKENNLLYFDLRNLEPTFNFIMADRPFSKDELKHLNKFISEKAEEGIKRIIVSSENLSGKMLGLNKSLSPNINKFIEKLKKLNNVEIKCILFVRRQDTLVESSYKFRYKKGYNKTFEEYLKFIDIKKLSWLDLVNKLKDNNINISVYPFEGLRKSSRSHVRLHQVFHDVFPNTKADDFKIKKINASLSNFTIKFLQLTNTEGVGFGRVNFQVDRTFRNAFMPYLKDSDVDNIPRDRKEIFIERVNQACDKLEIPRIKDLETVMQQSIDDYLQNRDAEDLFKLTDKQRNKILKYYEKENKELFEKHITVDFHVNWYEGEHASEHVQKTKPFSFLDIFRRNKAA